MTSLKQRRSNQKNARKSTGPRTEAGKARSRGNAFKHGLCGEGVVMPPEDIAEVDARYRAFADDLKPETAAELEMTRRAALLAVRLDRCAEREHATISKAVAEAVANHDARLLAEVESIGASLPDCPDDAVRRLRRTAQGVDWLVARWRDLRESLGRNRDLSATEIAQLELLQGRRLDASGSSPAKALAMAIGGDFARIGLKNPHPSQFDAIKDLARLELDKALAAQVDQLAAHRTTLNHHNAELDRLEAPLQAVVDTSAAGQLLRRYETAAARELYKIFGYFDENPREDSTEKSTLNPIECETSGELASFRNSGQAVLAEPSEAGCHGFRARTPCEQLGPRARVPGTEPRGTHHFGLGDRPREPRRAQRNEEGRSGGDDG